MWRGRKSRVVVVARSPMLGWKKEAEISRPIYWHPSHTHNPTIFTRRTHNSITRRTLLVAILVRPPFQVFGVHGRPPKGQEGLSSWSPAVVAKSKPPQPPSPCSRSISTNKVAVSTHARPRYAMLCFFHAGNSRLWRLAVSVSKSHAQAVLKHTEPPSYNGATGRKRGLLHPII